MFDSVFLNGTVGAGKTTTAYALSAVLRRRGAPHGWIDLDHLRQLSPAPAADPFHHEVELANLTAVAANYRSAGATRLIVAGVLECADDIARYAEALGGGSLLICRLLVDPDRARERLIERHVDDPDGREWHLRRTTELDGVLDRARLGGIEVDTSRLTPSEVALEVARRAGWIQEQRGS